MNEIYVLVGVLKCKKTENNAIWGMVGGIEGDFHPLPLLLSMIPVRPHTGLNHIIILYCLQTNKSEATPSWLAFFFF